MVVAVFAGLAVVWVVILLGNHTGRRYDELVRGVDEHRQRMQSLARVVESPADRIRRINEEANANWDDPEWRARKRREMEDTIYR